MEKAEKTSNAIELKIIRSTSEEILEVEWIEIQSTIGKFLVGLDHEPLISQLKIRGKISLKLTDGIEKEIQTYGGIFKVENNKAVIIMED